MKFVILLNFSHLLDGQIWIALQLYLFVDLDNLQMEMKGDH